MHLSEYMAKHDLDDEKVAEKIQRSRVTVSRIRRRIVRPEWDTIDALTKFSEGEITANDFQDIQGVDQ
jgi:hypothetical protein